MATNNLLHFSSFHPFHLRKGLPVGQYLHVRCNCTRPVDFQRNARDLSDRLQNREYPKRVISRAYQRARSSKREDLLTTKVRIPDKTLRFITQYNNQWDQLRNILVKHWGILRSDDIGLDKLKMNIRSGDPIPALVRKEARWIYTLKTLAPDGMNEEQIFTGFLEK